MNELPTITASAYASTQLAIGRVLPKEAVAEQFLRAERLAAGAIDSLGRDVNPLRHFQQPAQAPKEKAPMTSTRIVKIVIADPDEQVPLDQRVIHKTEEITTDLTDQELFYTLPVMELLAKHNAARATIVDKKTSSTTGPSYLAPIRIRDLRMVVVTVASF